MGRIQKPPYYFQILKLTEGTSTSEQQSHVLVFLSCVTPIVFGQELDLKKLPMEEMSFDKHNHRQLES